MNAFDRFGLRHLSPSSLNLWQSNPGLWALRYVGGFRDDAGPAAWRGRAVEKGLEAWLIRQDREQAYLSALGEFDNQALGLCDDDTDDERKLIEPMLDTAIAHCAGLPCPMMNAQAKVEVWFDDVPVPVIGFVDFVLEDGSHFDLKTTQRCPSTPRPEHARQVALYIEARQSPGSLLYVTAKRAETFNISDNERAMHIANLRRGALSLLRFLDRCETKSDAILSLPMNQDDFKWNELASNFLSEMEQDNAASHDRRSQLRQPA